jgi:hypothetical protein
MKIAGLVLDFYDDRTGEILKTACPDPENLPEAVSEAHLLSPEERDVLRDEAFALVLHSDDQHLRKFACVDAGNTVLSTLYFLETMDQLPASAVKVAAQNLAAFNEEFGLPVPEKLKQAFAPEPQTASKGYVRREQSKGGRVLNRLSDIMQHSKVSAASSKGAGALSRTRDSRNQPFVGDEADWAQRTNLISVRGGADSGRVIPTANQMKTAGAKPPDGGVILTDDSRAIPPEKVKPFKKVANQVDVATEYARPVVKVKKASYTALNGQYALDSYSDVQRAIQFFEENWPTLPPQDRHEFAKTASVRADALGVTVPDTMARYGSTEYAPDVEAHLANRRTMAPDFKAVWDDLQEKRAMMEPETFAQLLREADELCGLNYEWGGVVCDPYFATFGKNEESEKTAASSDTPCFELPDGTSVTYRQLHTIPREEIERNFQPDFAEAFSIDPVTIFNSMPADTKQVIARMAKNS